MLKVSFAHFAMIFTEIRKRELYLLIIRLTPDFTSRSVFPLCLKKNEHQRARGFYKKCEQSRQ